ncbi:hypothetical protein U3516DRAFT_746544 [Neocallimastix sp. 'constans']
MKIHLIKVCLGSNSSCWEKAFSLSLKCIRISLNSLPYYFCVHDNLSLSKANMKDIHSI